MQIVYARAEQTKLVETGRMVTRDLNYFPEMTATWEGRAGMYLRQGTSADVFEARRRLEPEGYTILTFPPEERDPLGKARDKVVAKAKTSAGRNRP
jgi:hypothetical protein